MTTILLSFFARPSRPQPQNKGKRHHKPTVATILLTLLLAMAACTRRPANVEAIDQLPPIFPDYVGVTIPAGIAPLNFNMATDMELDAVDVGVTGSKGGQMHTTGAWADFDTDQWHELTRQNQGGKLEFTVSVLRSDGKWLQYKPFQVYVSPFPLDEWGLTYRRIAPGYEVYSHMGLYQRNLATFDEYAIIDNTSVPGMCVNCHTAWQTNPERFVFHIRGDHGATLVQTSGKAELLKASNEQLGGSMVYPYWHPSGQYCAFSTNQTRQAFHIGTAPHPMPTAAKEKRAERIEVFDLSSDVFVYSPQTHEVITTPLLQTKEWSENCPTFSPDGRWLYFLTCLQQSYPANYKQERYNLCRIAFDAETQRFGTDVDTLLKAADMGKSITWPRPSYDGRFLLFTLADYGYFSVWHEESDQWLMDLSTMQARPLNEINSPRADSYHNWSHNSRWVVFTSRRGDGLYTRLYLASIDQQGRASKPFLLPQRNPWSYYDQSLYSFNTPDFTQTRVSFDAHAAARRIVSTERQQTHVREKE